MKNLYYGIFVEDQAIRIFLEEALPQLLDDFGLNNQLKLEHCREFSDHKKANKGGGYISKHFIKFILRGIFDFGIEVCFVGRDADDDSHDQHLTEMTSQLIQNNLENKAVILIPVQAIEYWLWYNKEKQENPSMDKTSIIDKKLSRLDVKRMIYETSRPKTRYSNPIVRELSQDIDFDWLNAHSKSFKHFYFQFKNHLNKILNS